MMADRDVQVAIIGAGTAGLSAYKRARSFTDDVLLIESGPHGTLCARTGCMPSKLLVAAADKRHAIDQAPTFGIEVGDVRVNGEAVMARVRALRDDFVQSVIDYVDSLPEEHRLKGRARFAGPDRLEVDGVSVKARAIVIATGSTTSLPDLFEDLGNRLLTNERIFELECLPESVALIGGGVIGLELGQALHRLGVRVKIFEIKDHLGPNTDPQVRSAVTRLFSSEMETALGASIEQARADGNSVTLRYRVGDGECREETFQYLLAGTGRRPVLGDLDLEQAGLELDDRGIPDYDPLTLQCGDSCIFIAGDANHRRPFLHEAAADGRAAGENAARFPDPRAHPRWPAFSIAFTDPQIAMVGAAYDQLDRGRTGIGTVPFEDQGRSRVIAADRGCARLYGDRDSGCLVGAELVGPAAEHLAHLLAWSIEGRLTVHDMLRRPFYHPVIEEGLRTALKDLRRDLDMGPRVDPDCIDCGPGV